MEIKKSYIYRYTDNGKSPLCIYLCDTQAKNRILIMPLTSEGSEHTYKLSVTKQYADLANYKEINKDSLVSALFLNSKPVKISISDLTVYYQKHFGFCL